MQDIGADIAVFTAAISNCNSNPNSRYQYALNARIASSTDGKSIEPAANEEVVLNAIAVACATLAFAACIH